MSAKVISFQEFFKIKRKAYCVEFDDIFVSILRDSTWMYISVSVPIHM